MAIGPDQVQQLFFRGPRIAQRIFGLDSPGQLVRSVPRTRFMFKVEFQPSAGANDMMRQANLNSSTGLQSVAFKVKQIDKPRVGFTTVELNQYNKKRLAYTKVEYNDASIKIHDTVDNSILALWVNYYTYYIGDGRKKSDESYYQSPVNKEFDDSTGWGFRPLSESSQFFDRITVQAFYAQTYTSFSYINPRITSIDWQQKDYASSEPEEVTVNFKYEAIEYEHFGEPATDLDTGFIQSDALEVPGPEMSKITPLKPRLFSNQIPVYSQQEELDSSTYNPQNRLSTDDITEISRPVVAPGSRVPKYLLVSPYIGGLVSALNGNPFVGRGLGMVFDTVVNDPQLLGDTSVIQNLRGN